jgi:hypothetical protein
MILKKITLKSLLLLTGNLAGTLRDAHFPRYLPNRLYIEDKTSLSSINDFFYDDPDMLIIVPPWSLAHSIHALRPLLVWCEFASARSTLEDISSFIISS